MRIVFLSSLSVGYPLLTGRVLPVAKALTGAGHQVEVLALDHDWPAGRGGTFLYGGVPVRYVGPMHVRGMGDARRQLAGVGLLRVSVVATLRMAWAALTSPADLYHVWKPHPFNGMAGLLAARLHGRPFFLDCDDYEAASTRYTGRWQRGIVRWFEDALPRKAAGVTVNTRFWKDRLTEALGVPAGRVAYIPNGVEPERFALADLEKGRHLRERLGLADKATVVYVGFLSLTGHPLDLLLEAFAWVARSLPSAHLVLVGGGEDGPMLRRRVEEMGLAGRVTFVGMVPPEEVALYYLLGDCSVDPVRDDVHARARCPLKVLESMACGVPVVTGDVGDRRELLDDGRAGLLVRPGDVQALAEGIELLLVDPARRARIEGEARRQVQNYRWTRLGLEMLHFYQRILGR